MPNHHRFITTIALFDEANRADPTLEEWEGQFYPKELLYAQRMSDRMQEFAPDASEALQLAARCQHICRWEIPRSDFPMDRKGYHQWRTRLQQFHAEKAGELMARAGYDTDMISRVAFLLQKKQLKRDPETQTLEDVICLVFLSFYFEPFSEKYADEKMIDILQKTWQKMSDAGKKAALQLSFSDHALSLIRRATNEE